MQGVIPYLNVDGADKVIAFYEKAFGAKDLGTMRTENGKHVMHSQLEINGGALMLSEASLMEGKQVTSNSYTMQLVTREGDKWWKRAVDAGYRDLPHLQADEDLAPVRALPGFAPIAQRLA
jgi:uncharacterized glyoxalase superfamily protein PhnB